MNKIYHDFECMVMRCEQCHRRHEIDLHEWEMAHNGPYPSEVETVEDDFYVYCDDCEAKIG